MAARLFSLLRPSILRNSFQNSSPKFNTICVPPSLRFKRYVSSSLAVDCDAASTPATDEPSHAISSHPWPEWVSFVDKLKARGYITVKGSGADDEGAVVYTDMKFVKDASLSFARDRFDIFRSLSPQDIQTIVEKGCPSLFRKAVNSAKRLRAHLELDEGEVCSSCNLRESCDRAYILLSESEDGARTVDVVRILLLYALDPLVISGENKPPGMELIESSARKLLLELVEFGESPPDPNLPKPASVAVQRKKQSLDESDNRRNRSLDESDNRRNRSLDVSDNRRKQSFNLSDNKSSKSIEMKAGDWVCTECNFMNFARNVKCRDCEAERPKSAVSTGGVEMKKGDWNCSQCSGLNFAKNKQCFRCQTPRPQRDLKPGDWECPDCDFLNFSRNSACRKCNRNRPIESGGQETWKRPY